MRFWHESLDFDVIWVFVVLFFLHFPQDLFAFDTVQFKDFLCEKEEKTQNQMLEMDVEREITFSWVANYLIQMGCRITIKNINYNLFESF